MKTIIPQIIYLLLTFIELLLKARWHGKEEVKKHNFWIEIFAVIIVYTLLYYGGFFNSILSHIK